MKKFGKILAMVMVALMMMSTVSFAAADFSGAPAVSENTVTVTLADLTAGEEATILVVKDGVELKDVTNSDIVYIDQLTVKDDKTVTFAFDASSVVPETVTEDVYVDIYCGYTNMDVTKGPLAGTAKVCAYVPEVTLIYGDVNGDTKADATDAGLVLQAFAKMITFTDSQTLAADVNGDTKPDATDAGLILQKFAKLIDKFPVEDAQ